MHIDTPYKLDDLMFINILLWNFNLIVLFGYKAVNKNYLILFYGLKSGIYIYLLSYTFSTL